MAIGAAVLIVYFAKIKKTTKKANSPKHYPATSISKLNNYINSQHGFK